MEKPRVPRQDQNLMEARHVSLPRKQREVSHGKGRASYPKGARRENA